MEKNLDILNKVRRVEVPPFLFTRIHQSIQSVQNDVASVKFKFAFAIISVLIIVLNINAFSKLKSPENTNQIEVTTSSYYSSLDNNIYHE